MSGRVDADDYTKEDARDFALWKAVEPDDDRLGDPAWAGAARAGTSSARR
jgi:cysteinyl-tRNA synthetase